MQSLAQSTTGRARHRWSRIERSIMGSGFLAAVLLAGCIEQSTTPVVFDQVIESTTLENQLLAPIIVFRNGAAIDTLEARTTRTYPLGAKGIFGHAWQLISPVDIYGNKAGIELRDSLGIQYRVRDHYIISNETPSIGTIFTPRILNGLSTSVRLTVNWREANEVITNYVIYANSNSSLSHAPYYHWHSDSNVWLTATNGAYSREFSRDDTTFSGDPELELSNYEFSGAGLTNQLVLP